MNYEVSEASIQQATVCSKRQACLHQCGYRCCEVIESIGTDVHFVDPAQHAFCDYRLDFGGGQICVCPVRKELFNRHGV